MLQRDSVNNHAECEYVQAATNITTAARADKAQLITVSLEVHINMIYILPIRGFSMFSDFDARSLTENVLFAKRKNYLI